MLISENVHHLLDAFDRRDLSALATFLHDDFQMTGDFRPLNKAEFLALYEAYFAAFSSFDFNFTDAAQDGQTVRVRWAPAGTHSGTLDLNPLGIPVTVQASNKTITLSPSVAEIQFDADGKVIAMVVHQGAAVQALLTQLGAELPAE